jgi:hypothetical protein
VSISVRETEAGDHLLQLYDDDEQLVDGVAVCLGPPLCHGDVAIVVATRAHGDALATKFELAGVDVAAAKAADRLVVLDAAETMDKFVVDGVPDPELFDLVMGGLVRQAQASGRRLYIFGEMVGLLWAAGQVAAVIELERLWAQLVQESSFFLLCAYSRQLMGGAGSLSQFDKVCQLHSAIVAGPLADMGNAAAGGTSRTFAKATDAPRAARHFVLATLHEWGADQLNDDAALVVTELTTNAVVHARSEFRVVLSATPTSVRISVADTSPTEPGCRDFSLVGSSGRGLGLGAAISSQWGTAHVQGGKVVWAELRR